MKPARFSYASLRGEQGNGGQVSMGAATATGQEVGTGDVRVAGFAADVTMGANSVSFLGPAGLRMPDAGSAWPKRYLSIVSGFGAAGVGSQTVEYREGKDAIALDAADFFPSYNWVPSTKWVLGDGWAPGVDTFPPADASGHRVVVVQDEESQSPFGESLDERGGRRLEDGETLELANTTLVGVNGSLVRWEFSDRFEELFAAGRPAPLGGATFGLGVLSTPSATVVVQSANPIVEMETSELPRQDAALELLRESGVTDASDVEWLSGPTRVLSQGGQDNVADGGAGDARAAVTGYELPTLLGVETGIESFAGLVNGTAGPWGVGVHVARATPDDHVIAVGVQRWPIGTGTTAAKKGDTTLFDKSSPLLDKASPKILPARSYMAAAIGKARQG